MKRAVFLVILFFAFTMMLTTACGSDQATAQDEIAAQDGHAQADEHMDEAMAGMDHVHVAAPGEFASLQNPLAGDADAIAAGSLIFENNCATCHGPEGKGDGPAAAELDPQPATLADGAMMAELSDGYLFWRVSKGGAMEPFNSAMPAWESGLSEQQRWQVISFVRSLTGEAAEHAAEEHAHDDEAEHVEAGEHVDEGDHADDLGHADETEHMEQDENSEHSENMTTDDHSD